MWTVVSGFFHWVQSSQGLSTLQAWVSISSMSQYFIFMANNILLQRFTIISFIHQAMGIWGVASSLLVYGKEQKKPRKPKPEINKHNNFYICTYTQFLYIVLLLKDVNGNVTSGNMKYVNFFSHTINKKRRRETELRHNWAIYSNRGTDRQTVIHPFNRPLPSNKRNKLHVPPCNYAGQRKAIFF